MDHRHIDRLIDTARAHLSSGMHREALAGAEQALAMRPAEAKSLSDLATILTRCDEPARAVPLFIQALSLCGDDPDLLYNLATAQRMTGDLIGAERNLGRALALSRRDGDCHLARSGLRTQTTDRNHIDEIDEAIRSYGSDTRRLAKLYFALSKELEDIGDFDRSFVALKRGSEIRRQDFTYDVRQDTSVIDKIITYHTEENLASGQPGHPTQEPIFIIGLPRTGTTLASRIVSAHGAVLGAGELDAFPKALIDSARALRPLPPSKEGLVESSIRLDASQLGARYLDYTRFKTGQTERFVDKLPLNYLYAGLIRKALPAAKMICIRRSPMDACFAIYKTYFESAYPFSYRLDEIAEYYAAWHRLTRHWQDTLGEAMLVIEYEDMVTDPDDVSKRMATHLRLPWESRMLSSHLGAGGIGTASAVQARQPIHAKSVGQWMKFAAHLDPLRSSLDRAGIVH